MRKEFGLYPMSSKESLVGFTLWSLNSEKLPLAPVWKEGVLERPSGCPGRRWGEQARWQACGRCEERGVGRFLVLLWGTREKAATGIILKFLQLKPVSNVRKMTWFEHQD